MPLTDPPIDPVAVTWSRNWFSTMADSGFWAVPRSGLIFTRRGKRLELTAKMPHDPAMPVTAEQLHEQQQSDYALIKRNFEAAGIPVTDATGHAPL